MSATTLDERDGAAGYVIREEAAMVGTGYRAHFLMPDGTERRGPSGPTKANVRTKLTRWYPRIRERLAEPAPSVPASSIPSGPYVATYRGAVGPFGMVAIGFPDADADWPQPPNDLITGEDGGDE